MQLFEAKTNKQSLAAFSWGYGTREKVQSYLVITYLKSCPAQIMRLFEYSAISKVVIVLFRTG